MKFLILLFLGLGCSGNPELYKKYCIKFCGGEDNVKKIVISKFWPSCACLPRQDCKVTLTSSGGINSKKVECP